MAESGRRSRTRRGRRDGRNREPGAGSEFDPTRDVEPDHESIARNIVLTKLTAQARTRHELTDALRKRDVPDDIAASVLDRMEAVGLVDDTAFAESWVSSRQSRRHLSKTALRHELVRKGVDRDQIDGALERVEPEDEYAAARALAEKKARGTVQLDPQVRYRRLAGALARKGFGSDLTRRVLTDVLDAEADH